MYLFPIWLRLWHLLNAVLCLGLIITGAIMYFGSGDSAGDGFHKALDLHIIGGIVLAASYVLFVTGNLLSSNGRYYRLVFQGLIRNVLKQLRYYIFGVFKKEQPPFPVTMEQKFNPMQQITYVAVMYIMMPLMIATGMVMLLDGDGDYRIAGINGALFMDFVHVCGAVIMVLFLIIHLYFATMGPRPGSHFRSLLSGYSDSH